MSSVPNQKLIRRFKTSTIKKSRLKGHKFLYKVLRTKFKSLKVDLHQMASNHDLQKTASKMEDEFLKRFSLRKFTVPQEKPKDFPNAFKDRKSDALEQGSSSQKSYRIEYKKLSSVIRTAGPWWLQSRGRQENMSSELLVTLVEDCGKRVYGSQFPISNQEKSALSSYSKDRQIDIMFSARNFMETNSVNGDFHPNGSPFSELRDTGCIGKRVSRLLGFLNNLEYVRLTSGCEKCRQQERERNESCERKEPSTSEFPDLVSNLNLCVCGLEVIDEEMGDLCKCLHKLMNAEQCNCHCAIKKLQELRRPLREIIKTVQCQAELSKKEKECSHVETPNLVPLDESISSKKKNEKPRSKLKDKLRCIPKRITSDEYVGVQNSSKRSKHKSKKSDTHREDDDASTSKQKTNSKKAGKRSRASKLQRRGKSNDKPDETADNRMMSKSKKVQKFPEVNRIVNEEKAHCHEDNDGSANRFKKDSKTDVTNLNIIRSAVCQRHFDEDDDSSEHDESFVNTKDCRHSDSEEEQYFVTSKQVQTDFQSQPIFVPCFIYDQVPRTKDRSEEDTIEICQDRGNRKLIKECPPTDRNKRVSFDSNHERSAKNETKTNYPQTIKPCCCDQCRYRRNFKGGAEVVDSDQDEVIKKRRRRSTVRGKCKCECSSSRNSSCLDRGIDDSEVYPHFSGSPNKRDLIGTYRRSTQRKKVIERNEDSSFPMRKSVTVKKETEKNYFYPAGEKSFNRNDVVDEGQTECELEDAKVPCSNRRSKQFSKDYNFKQTGRNRTNLIDISEQRRSVSSKRNSDIYEEGFDYPDNNRNEIVEQKQCLKNDIEDENVDDAKSTCNNFGASQYMDGYESTPIISKKTSKVQIMEDRSVFDFKNDTNGRRSIRKSLIEKGNIMKCENELDPRTQKRSSRTEIAEERKSLIPNSDSDSDEYDSVKKRTSRVEIVELKRSPSKTNNNFGERHSISNSLRPREDVTEHDYDLDPTIKTRSSRTEIIEETKSSSNRRNDDAINTDRRYSIRDTLITNSDLEEYDSVKKRSSQVEIVVVDRSPPKRKSTLCGCCPIRKSFRPQSSRTEIIDERKSNRSPSRTKTRFGERRPLRKSLRPREDITEYNRDLDPMTHKRSSRTEIKEERKSLIPDSTSDEYVSVSERTSRVEVMELNRPPSKAETKYGESRPLRKSLRPREDITEYNRDLDPITQKRSSRTNIKEERKSFTPDSYSDEYVSVNKRTSRVEVMELNRPPSKAKTKYGERRPLRKSLRPREDVTEYNRDLDPITQKRSSRTNIKEERKSFTPDSYSDEYVSVNKRTSRVEVMEFNRPPSKAKTKFGERRPVRKSLRSREDITEYNRDQDPITQKMSNRTNIKKERKSFTPDSYSDEYVSVNKRTSRVEVMELNRPPSKAKTKFGERRPVRKSLRPREDITEYNQDLDTTTQKRSSRTNIKEERKSLIPDSDSDSDEYDSVKKRTSQVEIVELNRSPSKTNNNFRERHSMRNSLRPREDVTEHDYDLDPTIRTRSSRTEIVEDRKSSSNRRNYDTKNTDRRYSVRDTLKPNSDLEEYDSVKKTSSKMEIVENTRSLPNETYSMAQTTQERRTTSKYLRPDDDEQPQTSEKSCGTEFPAKEQVQNSGNCNCMTQQLKRNNCVIALDLKPKCQDTQSTAICSDEDEDKEKCPWSITAIQNGGKIEAQLELKIQGVKCRISDNESPKPDDASAETFCNNCYGKDLPVVKKDLAKEIRKIVGNRERNCIFLKFTIVKNLYHIQISTENDYLGCLYATESATLQARKCKAFDGYTTLSVTEPSNTMSQIEELVDHAFVVVKKEDC